MKYIGEKIRELRRKNDMTQEKLADYLCVTYQTVSKWETGVTSPDLSLIVPLARLFKVTTDELFDFKESVEDAKRAELQKAYEDTFKSGDLSIRISVSEEAVKTYPGDMKWLNSYAWDLWCNAIQTSFNDEFEIIRNKVIEYFKTVIENSVDDEVKCHAIVGIVGCLNGCGKKEEARFYAEQYPETKINNDERSGLLLACMTGDEQIITRQQRLLRKVEDLLNTLLELYQGSPAARFTGEKIINAFIPDGNYLTFHNELFMIRLAEARAEICVGEYGKAISAMLKARDHATAFDSLKGEYIFTAPLFDHLKNNTENWCITGTSTKIEDFKALLDLTPYSPLKEHKNFGKLLN